MEIKALVDTTRFGTTARLLTKTMAMKSLLGGEESEALGAAFKCAADEDADMELIFRTDL